MSVCVCVRGAQREREDEDGVVVWGDRCLLFGGAVEFSDGSGKQQQKKFFLK